MMKHIITQKIYDDIQNGTINNLYDYLGSFIIENKTKLLFRTYSLNANDIFVKFENSNIELKMYKIFPNIFEAIIEYNDLYLSYMYKIITKTNTFIKQDPFAKYNNIRPNFYSLVTDDFSSNDIINNRTDFINSNLLIYETHLGSFEKINNEFLNYKDYAHMITNHMKEFGYNTLELMPIYEYPYDPSWGYQGTGFFAVNSRYGHIHDFLYMIKVLKENKIKIILDFVIGHINKDEHSIYNYDGTFLLEFDEKEKRENYNWGTANIDFKKGFAKSFFRSVLYYWLNIFKIDGYRIDAVSNLFYHLGDPRNGKNDEAINFLHEITDDLKRDFPNVILAAEDSSAFYRVTWDPKNDGIGFNLKWDMGYMNDILRMYQKKPNDRLKDNSIPFGISYNYSEKFILPFSHDEVVYGKGSMLNKMPGNLEDKFLNLKNLMLLTMTRPGKKLFFMGTEFAQYAEWNFQAKLDFNLRTYPKHLDYENFYKKLIYIYNSNKELYELDFNPNGFKWVMSDISKGLYIYKRFDKNNNFILIILNVSDNTYSNYCIHLEKKYRFEVLLSISKNFKEKEIITNSNNDLEINIERLNGIILKCKGDYNG